MGHATPREQVERHRSSYRLLAFVWVPAVVALVIAGIQDAVDPGMLMRDPATTTDQPASLGLFSSLGMIAWNITWVVLAGSAYVLHKTGASIRLVQFAGCGALLAAVLMVDDLFLGHESAGRQGVPQTLIFGLYGAAAISWVWHFRDQLRTTAVNVLIAAAILFATSLAIDLVFESIDATWRIVSEDGAKFLAILAMAVWAVSAAQDMLVPRKRAPSFGPLIEYDGKDPVKNRTGRGSPVLSP